jgi:hypothetical protein
MNLSLDCVSCNEDTAEQSSAVSSLVKEIYCIGMVHNP